MKKNDWILLVVILCAIGIGLMVMHVTSKPGDVALVKLDGDVVFELPLDKDDTIFVHSENGGENTIEVKDGSVRVVMASCPDQYCVKHKKINKSKETIVCLPNKLVVEIQSQRHNEFDAITN